MDFGREKERLGAQRCVLSRHCTEWIGVVGDGQLWERVGKRVSEETLTSFIYMQDGNRASPRRIGPQLFGGGP